MSYSQITHEQRFCISWCRKQGMNNNEIAIEMERHRSTIGREIARNSNWKGVYRPSKAVEKTNGRRSRSRKGHQFTCRQTSFVIKLIKRKWSPEQVSGVLRRLKIMSISDQTIYNYIKLNHKEGGDWWKSLRHSNKRRRKRYGAYDSRGVLPGKRPLADRPRSAETRSEIGHFEIDTVWGAYKCQHSILTLVDRKTGFVMIGKLRNRTTAETNACILKLMRRHPGRIKTISSDNGTEFHGYEEVEAKMGIKFYFCEPYHSWERGSNENMNGLIRQYLRKGKSMKDVTQRQCDSIATHLNQRPRKRYGYIAPEVLYG